MASNTKQAGTSDSATLSTSDGRASLEVQEYEPLTDILSHIPHKVQRGLSTQYEILELTCMDANQHFIALGSSVGMVFLFEREKYSLQKLKSEDTTDAVTSVCLHHGLEDQVAIGYRSGVVYIYQLPSMQFGHTKKLERFVVKDTSIHSHPITCLAWSVNGMKLFSGDCHGTVGCTEVDFIEGQCKTSVLLIEANTEIVQLHHGHRSLLVSTKHRCVVCRMDDKTELIQIGSKDRKITGDFGACFIPAMCKVEDSQLYASRPGLRVWKSSISGSVSNTFMFKDLIAAKHPSIRVLDFEVTNITKAVNGNQFGPLVLFRDKELVTWNDCCLYVIDPDQLKVVGTQHQMGLIKTVAVTGTEIFILRQGTSRNLIRIAEAPLPKPRTFLAQIQERLEAPAVSEVESNKQKTAKPTEKSPFKLFQGNILDKMKNIPKPAVIKDKIQEKLVLELGINEKPVSKGYVVSDNEQGTSQKARDISPPGTLPPVVRLDTPDLLELELSVELNVEGRSPSVSENAINNSSGSQQHKDAIEQSANGAQNQVLARQTGTGAISALARLQEDHQVDEDSEPIYRFNSFQEDSKEVTGSEERKMALFEGDLGEDGGGIVFRRKTKVKQKKKKKVTKDRRLTSDVDSDRISVNSTNSITSETSSGTVSSVKQMEQSVEGGLEKSTEQYTESDLVRAEEKQSSEQSAETAEVKSDQQSLESNNSKSSNQLADEVPLEISNTDKCANEDKEEKSEVDRVVETDKSLPGITLSDSIELDGECSTQISVTKCEQLSHSERGTNTESEPDEGEIAPEVERSIETLVNKAQTDEDSVQRSGSLDNQSEPSPKVDEESAANADKVSDLLEKPEFESIYATGNSKTSLDIEVARLESYLSESSEAEKSGSFYIRSKPDEEMNSTEANMGYTDHKMGKYRPCDLEKELAELERTAMVEDLQTPETPTLPYDENASPSIYTVYNKPGYEDFYSKYAPRSMSEMSSLPSDSSLAEQKDELEDNNDASEMLPPTEIPQFMKTLNTWTEISLQGNVYSLSVSSSHVWVTDRSTNIFYSALSGPGVAWKKASGNASQISVSRNGSIVWALNKGVVKAGTRITPKSPEGMKWVDAVKDVAYMCVDETCAWYIKTTHEVMIQKGLSRDRPCYTGIKVDCAHRLKQVVCRQGVVWALTEQCHWLYRAGVTHDCPQGTAWKSGDSGSDNRLFSHLALGEDNLGWAIDILGQVWFCTGVTMATPRGDGHWWQVALSSEYFMKDPTALDMLKSFSTKFDPQKLTLLLSAQSGGLVAGQNGVWVCPEYKNTLQICRGSIEGQIWREAYPESLADTCCWKIVDAKVSSYENGCVWSMQPNGDLFAFSSNRKQCVCIPSPKKDSRGVMFVCMSVCFDALWGLTDEGEVFIRTGMSSLEPRGSDWAQLDLSQLDESHLVSLSCANESVWSVDSDGNVFHRIGVKAPTDRSLNAAWLPVDNSGTVFTQIVSCEQDWKVWAIDNRRQVYVRHGITQEMPIGRKWIHVSGTQAMHLTLSNSFVWALNHSGELLCRHGVSVNNPTGDYWKKVPGSLSQISGTPTDVLWGINKEGQLVRRFTKYIIRTADVAAGPRNARQGTSISSDDGDWEFV